MAKRVLFISPIGFLPPDAGHRARVAALIASARELGHDVWFHGLGLSREDEELISKSFGDRASFSQYIRPRDMKPRIKGIWAALRHRYYTRTDLPRPIDFWFQDHWLKDLETLTHKTRFDTVVTEYVFATRGLSVFPVTTRKLVDTHDLFHEQSRRLAKIGLHDLWRRIDARNERKGLLRGDVIVAIQDDEARAFQRLLKGARPVVTVSHPVHIENLWNPESNALTVGYLATANELNVLSAKWFLSEVWPGVIEHLPTATLLIGGTICSRLAPAPQTKFLGLLASPRDLYRQARLIINPMLTGTGLKIKTVEALGFGMPTVATNAGASGLEVGNTSNFIRIAQDSTDFANQVKKMLPSGAELAKLSANALSFAGEWNRKFLSAWASAL
jgi:glycosyltransferase involved in cell wall biosynthesis